MTTGPEERVSAAEVRQRVRQLVDRTIADPAAEARVRSLVAAADAGDAAAWEQLASPPDEMRAGLTEIIVVGPVHPFPRSVPNPLDGLTARVQGVIADMKQDPDRADHLYGLATAVLASDDEARLNELLSFFARSPDDLARMTPMMDEKVLGVDHTWITTTLTITFTTTTTTVTTLVCTSTTTLTTTGTTTTTTTTSHLCT